MNFLQYNLDILREKTNKTFDIDVDIVDIKKLAQNSFIERNTNKEKKKERTIITISERCVARIWGDGSGLKASESDNILNKSQCKSKKMEGENFCKGCKKKSTISMKILNSDKKGLRFGTINDPVPFKNENNKVEIVWDINKDIDYSQYGMIWKNNKWRSHDYTKIVEHFDESTREYKNAIKKTKTDIKDDSD
jgi:hypothetical protein